MIKDGSFQALFDQEFGPVIKRLDMDHRRVIELANPLLGDKDPLADSSLWYRPGMRSCPDREVRAIRIKGFSNFAIDQDTSFINHLVRLKDSEVPKIAGIEVVGTSESPH